MKTTVHHVIGDSQYEGSCKFHLFADCTFLTRARKNGRDDLTGHNMTEEYDLKPEWVCKVCRKRKERT